MTNERRSQLSPETTKKISLVIAAIIVFGILAIIGQVFKDKIKNFQKAQTNKVFPQPAKMPQPLNITVKEALDRLDKALEKYNKNLKRKMNPGLSIKQIIGMSGKKHISLPKELYTFYSWHNGSNKTDDSLEWFVPLDDSLNAVSKKRANYQGAKSSGDLKSISLAQMTAYQRNWMPLYKTSSYCSLNADISRKPEEGAWFWTDSNQKVYYFFPSLQNALTALAECFEQKAFKVINKIEKNQGIHRRNQEITGKTPKQLLVNARRVNDIMTKYGSCEKASGFLTH